MNISFAFGIRITFVLMKAERGVLVYVKVSISEKKVILSQKVFQRNQLGWLAGKAGA